MRLRSSILALLAVSTAAVAATPYAQNFLTAPADWTGWTANGSLTETASGLSSTSGGSLIFNTTASAEDELRVIYKVTQSGGNYVAYLRATPDARLSPSGSTGQFIAVELQNPQLGANGTTATLVAYRFDGTQLHTLSTAAILFWWRFDVAHVGPG